MPNKRRLITFCLAFLSGLFISASIRAENADPIEWQRQGPLELGMDAGEVLTAWGPPKSRLERETAREEIWEYPRGRAVFALGKLKAWDLPTQSSATVAAPTPSPKPTLGQEYRVEDILGDLLKTQSPAEEDTKPGFKKLPSRPLAAPVGRAEPPEEKQ